MSSGPSHTRLTQTTQNEGDAELEVDSLVKELDEHHHRWMVPQSDEDRRSLADEVFSVLKTRFNIDEDQPTHPILLRAMRKRVKRENTYMDQAIQEQAKRYLNFIERARLLYDPGAVSHLESRGSTSRSPEWENAQISRAEWLLKSLDPPADPSFPRDPTKIQIWSDPPPRSWFSFWSCHQQPARIPGTGCLGRWRTRYPRSDLETEQGVIGLLLLVIHQTLSGASREQLVHTMRDEGYHAIARRVGETFFDAYDDFTETNSIEHIQKHAEKLKAQQARMLKLKNGMKDVLTVMTEDNNERAELEKNWGIFSAHLEDWKLTYGDGSRAMGAHTLVWSVFRELTTTSKTLEEAWDTAYQDQPQSSEPDGESGTAS